MTSFYSMEKHNKKIDPENESSISMNYMHPNATPDKYNVNIKNDENLKMYVFCDPNEQLKVGCEPIFVYAHFVEITSTGLEIERIDLTRQINIYTYDTYLHIGPFLLVNYKMSALIEVPNYKGSTQPTEGTLHFKYSGMGRTFLEYLKLPIAK